MGNVEEHNEQALATSEDNDGGGENGSPTDDLFILEMVNVSVRYGGGQCS